MPAVVQAKEAKDQLLLCLADMENLRARSAQQVENNRKFAIQVQPSATNAVKESSV